MGCVADLVELALLLALGAVVVLLLAVLLRLRRDAQDPRRLGEAMRASLAESAGVLQGALATSVQQLGIVEDLGSLRAAAQEIQRSSRSLERVLEVKRARADLAEFQLKEILRDLFPAEKVRLQTPLPGLGTPDAHIATPEGLLCIDAKFPLEGYRRMVEAEAQAERRGHARRFARDVGAHVEKIATTYVRPEAGSAPYALGFLPAEAVYQYLTEAEPDLLREAALRGVNLVSPSTLIPTLNVLASTLRAHEIAERAEEIEGGLRSLERQFRRLDDAWRKVKTHFFHAYQRLEDADAAYGALRLRFERVVRLGEAPSGQQALPTAPHEKAEVD